MIVTHAQLLKIQTRKKITKLSPHKYQIQLITAALVAEPQKTSYPSDEKLFRS